jgi:hypothetical protein
MQHFERRVRLRKSQKPSLTIFPLGIAHESRFVSWTKIGSCRWNRYAPELLVIALDAGLSHFRHAVWIPQSHRALVEEIFRRFGKWDQPGAVDEVNFETGTSINLPVWGTNLARSPV